jgi:transcriptional regulator with GAF, ATPase, and Fis domain
MVDHAEAEGERLNDWWLSRHNSKQHSVQLMHLSSGQLPGSLEARVGAYEKSLIIEALKRTGGNQTKAAHLLGTTKRIIQYKVKKYNIDFRHYAHRALAG